MSDEVEQTEEVETGPDPDVPEVTDEGVAQHMELAELENAPFAGSPGVTDFLGESGERHGAIVVDEAAARNSGCIGYALHEDRPEEADLVFARHGAVGALNRDQRAQFCPTVELQPLSERQKERLRAFKESTQVCKLKEADVPKGERLDSWIGCMSHELRERGHRL